MKRNYLTLAIAAPVLALAGCGGTEKAPTDTTTIVDNLDEMAGNVGDAAGNAMTDMTATSGQEFVNMAASSDAYEIEAGKLAQTKATAPALKDFGAMMVADHAKSSAALKEAAAAAVPAITPDATMSAEQAANLDTLRSATGADFDSAYKAQQLTAHRKALAALQDYAAGSGVPELKQWAATTAPVVKGHLDKLEAM